MITINKQEMLDHLQDIRTSIKRDIKPEIWQKDAGFFAFIRSFFSYIDYLGLLAFGRIDKNGQIAEGQSTVCSVKFIQAFFNHPYEELASLLVYMYRHGTIHQYQPKFILLNGGKNIGFMTDHPSIMEYNGEVYHHLHYKNNFLPFSLEAAYEDILKALDEFEQDIIKGWSGDKDKLVLCENFSNIYQVIKNGIGYGYLKKEVQDSIDNMLKT